MIPLGLLSCGESGEITEIRIAAHRDACGCSSREGGDVCHCSGGRNKGDVRIEDMGIRVGKSVEMLSNGAGPVLLKVDESRIAVDRGMAMKIMVRRIQ